MITITKYICNLSDLGSQFSPAALVYTDQMAQRCSGRFLSVKVIGSKQWDFFCCYFRAKTLFWLKYQGL